MEIKISNPPLISIIIATRNRIPYALSAIRSILEIPDPRFELVVQDNSDSRELESNVSENISDNRLRYRYTPPPLSSIGNFNAALEMATGEYLCLIGDDDGVNPEIIEAADWVKREDLDSLTVKKEAGYLWPGSGLSSTIFTKTAGGILSISDFIGSIIEVDVEKEMRKLLHNGGLYYKNFNLPKLYHGLVHRRCLKAIYERTGAYFGGLSPDIFASLAIACVAKRVAVTDYPLTISGVCLKSSTADARKGRHTGRLEDAPHLRDRGEYHWSELVPRVYSVETIWADSGIAALRAMGRDDLVQEINLPKLAAYCIMANRGVTGVVLRDLFKGRRITGKNPVIGAIQFTWALLSDYSVKFVRRVWNRILMIVGKRVVHSIDGVENMVEASHALTRYLKENARCFSRCLYRRSESR